MWVLVALVLSMYFMFYWWPRRHYVALASQIPGPIALPLVGNLLLASTDMERNFSNGLKFIAKYGQVLRLWAGPKLYVVLTDAADAQLILGNPKLTDKDSWQTSGLATFLGVGLLTSRGDEWKLHRKLITPAFHFKILKMYTETFGRKAELLLDRLEEFADGRTIDIHPHFNVLTGDSIIETVFGTNLNLTEGLGQALNDSLHLGSELVLRRTMRPWFLLDWLYDLSDDGRRAKELKDKLKGFSEAVITEKMRVFHEKAKEPMGNDDEEEEEEEEGVFRSFLDVVVEESESGNSPMTLQEISDEVVTLSVAAVETTSTMAACFVTLMGIFPNIQEKVYKELSEIFGTDTRLPTTADLVRMTYFECCLKEALRFFPVGIFLGREMSEDTPISRGYTLPKGCTALVFSYGVHHNPEYFPEPETFMPERWLSENSCGRHPYAFLAFGAGQRNCIGQKYAMLQVKTSLSLFLRRYKITSDTKWTEFQRLRAGTATQSVVGYNVGLHKRSELNND